MWRIWGYFQYDKNFWNNFWGNYLINFGKILSQAGKCWNILEVVGNFKDVTTNLQNTSDKLWWDFRENFKRFNEKGVEILKKLLNFWNILKRLKTFMNFLWEERNNFHKHKNISKSIWEDFRKVDKKSFKNCKKIFGKLTENFQKMFRKFCRTLETAIM